MVAPDVLARFRTAQRARGLSEGTIRARRYHLTRWFAQVGDPWTATAGDVHEWVGAAPRGWSARYGMVSHLHRFYVWAIAEGLTETDPTVTVERAKRGRHLPRPMPVHDFLLAVDMAEDPLVRAWLLLAGYSGLRCIELSRLRWPDVELGGKPRLRVVGKGDRERTVPLHSEVVGALMDLRRVGPWLAGRAMRASAVSARINRHLRELGISGTAHQLRHLAATLAYAEQRDILAVQDFLGHASLSTTQIYTKLDQTAVRSAVDSMPSLSAMRLAARERQDDEHPQVREGDGGHH